MNPTLTVSKTHLKGKWNWLYTPWIIVFSSFIVNLFIAGAVNDEHIYTGGIATIYFYMMAMGAFTLKSTFSFSLGFGITRKDYYRGTALTALLVNAISTVILVLLSLTENFLDGWKVKLFFFHLPYLNDGNLFIQACVIFLLLTNFYYFGFVMSCIFYRFQMVGFLVFTIFTIVLSSIFVGIVTYNDWWGLLFQKISAYSAFELSLVSIPLTIIYFVFSYIMLRRSTV